MSLPLAIPRTLPGKGFRALRYCLRDWRAPLRALRRGVIELYREGIARDSTLPAVGLHELLGPDAEVMLSHWDGGNGNVRFQELVLIAALVRRRQPRVMLEIGTFDGNTALQMAANSHDDATVLTLDLPPAASAAAPADPNDKSYTGTTRRRYAGRPQAGKIVQCLGDSATFDFAALAARHGRFDLVFIDGSHSYDYVKNDTEKALACLAPRGLLLWHDFAPAWPGVMRYLSELHQSLPLVRIAGTSLVLLDGAAAPVEVCQRRTGSVALSPA